jgi:D-inositol-3-phosphate glycosyltransferase
LTCGNSIFEMKIAMVSNDVTTRVAELSAALARHGHQVALYTRRDNPDRAEIVEAAAGYTLVSVPAGSHARIAEHETLTCMGPFAQYLETTWSARPPDVVHAHGWMTGIASALVTRQLGLPAVQTFDGLRTVPREHAQLAATVARSADWVAAKCTDEVFELMRVGRPRQRISVVPCGVDTDLFRPDGTRSSKCVVNRIVTVAGSQPTGSLDTLIRAMPMIAKTELVIVGCDDNRILDLAGELGVGRRVHLLGPVERGDMPEILRSAELVVSADPSGNGALEAMACGVPVVGPAIGALLDIVVPDVTGSLVPQNDPGKLAVAANVLLRDAFLRQSFGAAGRDRACARYSWDLIAEDMTRIYDRFIQSDDARATTPA